ncbi:MAG: DNA-processing protein DprA [Clostridiales bacterium]|nr:DNA-processing protein DprA [Clostridiales bacterium]
MRDYTQKERAWLWLNRAIGASVGVCEQLIYRNDGLLSLYEAVKQGKPVNYPEKTAPAHKAALSKYCQDKAVDTFIEELDRIGAYAVTRDSKDYPDLLREIYDPPTVLYVKGRLKKELKLPIAVIGSRKCSDYGREMARFFGKELAKNGACVVSGLAVGCDSVAAMGALSVKDSEFPTLAVLGSGINVVYPSCNRKLYDEIAERGAVISEYLPDRGPTRESFPQRNRIISGISKGVLVIEAAAKSGTSITVDFAHEQGRDVFAVPGRITDLLSVGTNGLIKSGSAKAVFGVDDVLYEYGLFLENPSDPVRGYTPPGLTPKQKKLYDLLVLGEKRADELCDLTGMSVSEINIYLTEMGLSGIIRQLANGAYSV